jgi:ubiquinone/menaquinone biosynthesis C-methylase UbiE
MRRKNTPWQKVAPWYNKITRGGEGHYYHEHVVIPGVLRLLNLLPDSKVLDLACGNGVLAGKIGRDVEYLGIDSAYSLIDQAKQTDRNPKHEYLDSDVARPLTIPSDFTHATIILALQNIRDSQKVLDNASKHMLPGGSLVIVLNHPAFRIPRQSSWGIDEAKKMQYRRIDKYMSPMNIPINMNPSDKNSKVTMSYHLPLSEYSRMLKAARFAIDSIEEWSSDKESVGRVARMENRSRSEIPLFLAIKAFKKA